MVDDNIELPFDHPMEEVVKIYIGRLLMVLGIAVSNYLLLGALFIISQVVKPAPTINSTNLFFLLLILVFLMALILYTPVIVFYRMNPVNGRLIFTTTVEDTQERELQVLRLYSGWNTTTFVQDQLSNQLGLRKLRVKKTSNRKNFDDPIIQVEVTLEYGDKRQVITLRPNQHHWYVSRQGTNINIVYEI